jgi:hypothetical protein
MAGYMGGTPRVGPGGSSPARRLATETKQAFKTTEFWIYVALLVALLIAGSVVDGDGQASDVFAADKVWLYATLLTIGYLLSRGLAKSGSRDPYWHGQDDEAGGESLMDRAKTAAAVLKDGEQAVQGPEQPGARAAGTTEYDAPTRDRGL